MKKTTYLLLTIFITSALLLGACNLPQAESPEDADATAVAETAMAVFTQAAETAAGLNPSETPTPLATMTGVPTNTLFPTQITTATPTPVPCNRASFVKDVSYADNTNVPAGTTFTKTWRLKNNGSCTWTSGYVLLFDSGDQMGASATASITSGSVTPGETVDISVNLTSPTTPGTYQGNFKLRSPDNIVFGINTDGQGPFWVKIVVPSPTATPTATSVPKPDLKITAYTLNPNPPIQNQNATISITVYNDGTAPAGAFVLEWWASTSAPAPACTWNIDSIVAKGGLVKTCAYPYPSWYSSITTRVIADSGSAVAESDEGNNAVDLVIQVNKP